MELFKQSSGASLGLDLNSTTHLYILTNYLTFYGFPDP